MNRTILTTLLIVAIMALISSCTTKQSAISQLEKFSCELRDNGRYYNIRDWEKAAEEFSNIRKKIKKYDYTSAERHRIGELEGQCAGYVYEGVKGRIQDYGNELNGILEGLLDIINIRF